MALRSGFFRWLIPAAFVLPLWLFIGWIVFGANPLSLLWVLLSAPIVLIGQLILTLLVRARPTARTEQAVSWTDLALIGGWNVLIVALGVFSNPWWWALFVVTVIVGVAALVAAFRRLWREARPAGTLLRTPAGVGYVPPPVARSATATDAEVIVVRENGASSAL
ncbi:MFS transporter permease [Microbacterium lacticum]